MTFNMLCIILALFCNAQAVNSDKSHLDVFLKNGEEVVEDAVQLDEIMRESNEIKFKAPNHLDQSIVHIKAVLLGWKMAYEMYQMYKEGKINFTAELVSLLGVDILANVISETKAQDTNATIEQVKIMWNEAVKEIQTLEKAGKYKAFEEYAQKLNQTIDGIKDLTDIKKGTEIIHQVLQEKPYKVDWRIEENKTAFMFMKSMGILLSYFSNYLIYIVDSKMIQDDILQYAIPMMELGKIMAQNSKNIHGYQDLQESVKNIVDLLTKTTDNEKINGKLKKVLESLGNFLAMNYRTTWSSSPKREG